MRPHRSHENLLRHRLEPHVRHARHLVGRDQDQQVRSRTPDTGIEQPPPAAAVAGSIDDEHGAIGDERPDGRIVCRRIDRHHAMRPGPARHLLRGHAQTRSRLAPERQRTRLAPAGIGKQLIDGGHSRARNRLEPAEADVPVQRGAAIGRIDVQAAARGRHDDGRSAPGAHAWISGHRQVAQRQECVACASRPGGELARAPPPLTAPPCLEALRLAQQTEVDEPRNVTVMQRREATTAQRPAQLLGRTSGAGDDERHLLSAREIARAPRGRLRAPRGVSLRSSPSRRRPRIDRR